MSNTSAKALGSLKFKPGLNIILTVGNTLRCDDAVGPYIAGRLNRSLRLKVIDAGDKPQNVIDEVINLKPCAVFIIDAADFQGRPGEIRLVNSSQISESSLSTHSIPLSVIAGIISQDVGCPVSFLGIQPKNVSLGENISFEVINAAKKVIEKINKEFSDA